VKNGQSTTWYTVSLLAALRLVYCATIQRCVTDQSNPLALSQHIAGYSLSAASKLDPHIRVPAGVFDPERVLQHPERRPPPVRYVAQRVPDAGTELGDCQQQQRYQFERAGEPHEDNDHRRTQAGKVHDRRRSSRVIEHIPVKRKD